MSIVPKEWQLKTRSFAKTIVDLCFLSKLRLDKQALDKLHTLPDLLPVLCRFRGKGTFVANQEPEELSVLCEFLLANPPRVVVEIGTAKGGTLYLWSRIVAPGALLVSIDKPGEVGSVGRPALSVYKRFGQERGIQVVTLPVDSHSENAHKRVREILGGRPVDFLFIDGDHTYEGVKADFYGYRHYMAPKGIIALHDVMAAPDDPRIEVGRFWAELQAQAPATRTVAAKAESPGIGVVFLEQGVSAS